MKKLSLIIATYNRAEQLSVVLNSVVAQSTSTTMWECIVVDNNSTDHTQEAFSNFIAGYPYMPIRMVKELQQGLSFARNRGIEESVGEYIAIIDDDERVNADFIEAYISFFDTHPDVASAGGKIIPEYPHGRPRWMSRFTEVPIANPIDLGEKIIPFPKGSIPGGGNMALRSSAIENHGPFNTTLGRTGTSLIGGEESDLFERLTKGGELCYYIPNAVMWHIIPPEKLTEAYFSRLSYNIGKTQRHRAAISGNLTIAIISELIKWCATLLIATSYLLTGRGECATWLVRMRRKITKGILNIPI